MSKQTKTPAEVFTEATATETVPGPEVDMAPWRREQALNAAIQFHKTNGGMLHPMQLVDNAAIFLSFLNGEIK